MHFLTSLVTDLILSRGKECTFEEKSILHFKSIINRKFADKVVVIPSFLFDCLFM